MYNTWDLIRNVFSNPDLLRQNLWEWHPAASTQSSWGVDARAQAAEQGLDEVKVNWKDKWAWQKLWTRSVSTLHGLKREKGSYFKDTEWTASVLHKGWQTSQLWADRAAGLRTSSEVIHSLPPSWNGQELFAFVALFLGRVSGVNKGLRPWEESPEHGTGGQDEGVPQPPRGGTMKWHPPGLQNSGRCWLSSTSPAHCGAASGPASTR